MSGAGIELDSSLHLKGGKKCRLSSLLKARDFYACSCFTFAPAVLDWRVRLETTAAKIQPLKKLRLTFLVIPFVTMVGFAWGFSWFDLQAFSSRLFFKPNYHSKPLI